MICLRDILADLDFSLAKIPYERLARLEVRMDHFLTALREVEPSAIREVFVEVPNVRWSDVGGLARLKQRLVEAVEWPLRYAPLYEQAARRSWPKPSPTKARSISFRSKARRCSQNMSANRSGRCATSFARPGRPRRASSSLTNWTL